MEPSRRVLVLTADSEQRKQLFAQLTVEHLAVRCPSGAAEALAIDREWNAELLIADFQVGSQSVTDLVDALHQQNPQLRTIILLPSGHTLEAMRELRCRAVAFLTRPFDPPDLLYFVRSALMQTESNTNRREHHRYPFAVETQLVLINPFDHSQTRPIPGLMRDVSRSGFSMILRQLLPVPSMLRLSLQLNDQSRPLSMLAKTISCTLTQIQGVYRVGAKFIGLLPREMAERLSELPAGAHEFDSDIYMGKSFKDAVAEWLRAHAAELPVDLTRSPDLGELAAEFGRVEDEHASGTGGSVRRHVGTHPPQRTPALSGTRGGGLVPPESKARTAVSSPVAERLLQHLARTPTARPGSGTGPAGTGA